MTAKCFNQNKHTHNNNNSRSNNIVNDTTTTISEHDKDGIAEQAKSMFIDGLIKMFLDFSTTNSLFLFFFLFNFQATFFNFLPLSLSVSFFPSFLSTVATPIEKKTWGNIFLFNEIVEAFLNFSARCRHVRETKSNQSSRLCVCVCARLCV